MDYQMAVRLCYPITTVLAAFLGNYATNDVATTFSKSALMERQALLVLHDG